MLIFACVDKPDSDTFVQMCRRKFVGLSHLLNTQALDNIDAIMHVSALDEQEKYAEMPICAIVRNGKPQFENCDLHFNLSHTEGYTVCAIASEPVGIDVERIRSVDREKLSTVVGEFLTDEQFFAEWTRREAQLKLSGKGLRGMRNFVADEAVSVRRIPIGEGFVCHVATYRSNGK